jgi:hypothetical protein
MKRMTRIGVAALILLSLTEAGICGVGGGGDDGGGGGDSPPSDPFPGFDPYGFAVPGHPTYDFGLQAQFGDNHAKDLLGLAAKGNVVLGDYTRSTFATRVLPLLRPLITPPSGTQPYVVDPTDAPIGYLDNAPGYCGVHHPCFDGDYTTSDGGQQLAPDGSLTSGRKFYESSLEDAEFRALFPGTMGWKWQASSPGEVDYSVVDAVLYTNHAITGYLPQEDVVFFGAVVARDDALYYASKGHHYLHDIRLLDGMTASQIVLPMTIQRPKLVNWKDVPPP